jgi:hypothetical protein
LEVLQECLQPYEFQVNEDMTEVILKMVPTVEFLAEGEIQIVDKKGVCKKSVEVLPQL